MCSAYGVFALHAKLDLLAFIHYIESAVVIIYENL